eukprot:7369791-Karenia_brevis.AAC.1
MERQQAWTCRRAWTWQQRVQQRVQRLNVISFSAAMPARLVLWQCGLLGLRVGEASHPGPSVLCPRCGAQMNADLVVPGEICMTCDGLPTQGGEIMSCSVCAITRCRECLSAAPGPVPTQLDEEDATMEHGLASVDPLPTQLDEEDATMEHGPASVDPATSIAASTALDPLSESASQAPALPALDAEVVQALRDLTIVRIDLTNARLSVSQRLLAGGVRHRCQLGTAPRYTGPTADSPAQAVRAWYDKFSGNLAPQTVADLGALLHAWERPAASRHVDTFEPGTQEHVVDGPAPVDDTAPVVGDATIQGDWLQFLPGMNDVDVVAQWLHPVPTVARVPPELEMAVLDILERLWHTVFDAIRTGATDTQRCAERLLHVLPKMLLAQPQRDLTRSEEAERCPQQLQERRAIEARLQLFYRGQWQQLLDLAEALWPLSRGRRSPQAPLGQGEQDGDDERRRADAVVSKCANTGCSSALQLLMSP